MRLEIVRNQDEGGMSCVGDIRVVLLDEEGEGSVSPQHCGATSEEDRKDSIGATSFLLF